LYRLTGLSTKDLADTLAKNPRAYMALKGAVAEKHLCIKLETLLAEKKIESFRSGSGDFEKDFYVKVKNIKREIIIECKNVQVINVSTITTKKNYLDFLYRNQYLDNPQYKNILPKKYKSFSELSAEEVKEAFKLLSLDLRESGLPRYSFSRNLSRIDSLGRLANTNSKKYLSAFESAPITIDFQRTRNSRDEGKEDNRSNRFYQVGEFDMVAACLFSRTLEWDFIFCSAKKLIRHTRYNEHYTNAVQINPNDWTTDINTVLDQF